MKVSINPAIRLGFWIAVFRLVSSNDFLVFLINAILNRTK